MDKELVLIKLESLRRCIARLREKTPSSALVLVGDYDLQDILTVNLERAVQVCVDIGLHIISESEIQAPATMGEVFRALCKLAIIDQNLAERMVKAVGFRNTAVHAYQDIDWDIVFVIITTRLKDFEQFAHFILKRLM